MTIANSSRNFPCFTNNYVLHYTSFPDRHRWQTISDLIIAFAREVLFVSSIAMNKIVNYSGCTSYCCLPKNYIPKKGSDGLYLLLHSLYTNPAIWSSYFTQLKKEHPTADICAPHIFLKKKGNLYDYVKPLCGMVLKYKAENPKKPVCLIGISNGARCAAALEIMLRKYKVSIKVCAISGPFFGSKLMNLASWLGVANLIFQKKFVDEITYGSQQAKDLIKGIQSALPHTYEFYATRDDYLIIPYTSCFPKCNNEESYLLLSGYGHNTVAEHIRKQVLASCIQWMKEHRKNRIPSKL